MNVKCPSCGKVFDIPKAQNGKMLRCLCRSLFRAKPSDDVQDIADISNVQDPDETQESQRHSAALKEENSDEISAESSISEQELDSYLTSLKKSRVEAQVESKAKNTAASAKDQSPRLGPPEQKNLELSHDPYKVAALEKELDDVQTESPASQDLLIAESESQVAASVASPRESVIWYKDFRILAASFAMVLIVIVSVLTLISKKEEKKPEDPYLTQLLTPIEKPEPVKEARPTPPKAEEKQISKAPEPESKPISKPTGNSLQDRLLKEFYEGRFENIIRLASSAKELNSEERALQFEALVQRANDNRSRLQEIKTQIMDERKRTQSPVFLRSVAAAMVFSASDTKELLQAIEILKNLAVTRSRDPLIFVYLGYGYHEIERPDLMNQAWNDAMNLAPYFPWLIEQRLDHFLQMENFTKAIEMAERLKKLPGKEQRGLIRLAKIALAQNKEDIAMGYYRDALKVEEDAAIHLAIGQYRMTKSPKIAIKEFEAGLKLDPDTITKRDLYFYKGKAHCKEKDFKSAIQSFNKSVGLDNHYYPAQFEKGNCQLVAGQAGAAAEAFEAALGQSPNNSTIWMTYGYTLLRLKKMRAAVGALRRSLDIKESDKAHYYMALVLIQLGKRQEALDHAKRAYKLNPKNAEAKALALRNQ